MQKVLVIDDSITQLRVVQNLLKDKYQVLTAMTGEEGKVIALREHPDVILLDYEMPVFDGVMTLKMIRNYEELIEIPVVFVTGVNDKKHIEEVLKLKPAGYLLKPPEPQKLYEVLERVTGKY